MLVDESCNGTKFFPLIVEDPLVVMQTNGKFDLLVKLIKGR